MQQEHKVELKEYDRKFEEIKDITSKTKQKYVPELCEILRKADPTLKGKEIGDKVKQDCEDRLGWNWDTVQQYLPSFAVNEKASQSAKKRYEAQNREKLEKISKIFGNLQSVNIPPPPEPKERSSYSEELDEKLTDIGLGSYGEGGKTIFGIRGDIHQGARICFRALCDDKEIPYGADEDVLVDYIKPTREYRLNIALESSESERADLHNIMHNLILAAEDMITQIDKADKK